MGIPLESQEVANGKYSTFREVATVEGEAARTGSGVNGRTHANHAKQHNNFEFNLKTNNISYIHYRPSYCVHTYPMHPIYFLHLGKCAGSQIKHLLTRATTLQPELRFDVQRHSIRLAELPPDAPYFFSVRDPVSRFKSAFYSRKRKGQPLYFRPWSRLESEAFSDFQHANELAEALFLEGAIGQAALRAMNGISHVKRLQVDWFSGNEDFLAKRPPEFIVRQEFFEDDFSVFLKKIGCRHSMSELNPAGIRVHSYDYSGDPQLSELAKKNLAVWYSRDIEFYRVCSDWIRSAAKKIA